MSSFLGSICDISESDFMLPPDLLCQRVDHDEFPRAHPPSSCSSTSCTYTNPSLLTPHPVSQCPYYSILPQESCLRRCTGSLDPNRDHTHWRSSWRWRGDGYRDGFCTACVVAFFEDVPVTSPHSFSCLEQNTSSTQVADGASQTIRWRMGPMPILHLFRRSDADVGVMVMQLFR